MAFRLGRRLPQHINCPVTGMADMEQSPAAGEQFVYRGNVIICANRDLLDFYKRTEACVVHGDSDRLHWIRGNLSSIPAVAR